MSNDQVIILVLYITGFFISVLITRAIFSIGVIVRQLKAQTALLYHNAKIQGVKDEIIKKIEIINELKIPKETSPKSEINSNISPSRLGNPFYK